jgi:salicylate 5-hydroxylase small subunit
VISADDLFVLHGDLLDEDYFDEWLDLFVEDCSYRVIARENAQMGLPLATIRCDNRGYLLDRVQAVRQTAVYTPRSQRHVIGRARAHPDGSWTASYAVFQCLPNELPQTLSVGRYRARLRESQFEALDVIYDSCLVPNSFIKPL